MLSLGVAVAAILPGLLAAISAYWLQSSLARPWIFALTTAVVLYVAEGFILMRVLSTIGIAHGSRSAADEFADIWLWPLVIWFALALAVIGVAYVAFRRT